MTAAAWKERVAAAFDRASGEYDRHARLQKRVAGDLAEHITQQVDTTQVKHALEIGCGTGFLTLPLVRHYSHTRWTITDLSPRMLDECRRQLQSHTTSELAQLTLKPLDGESVDPARGTYDLICSNLTLQWFTDWQSALERLMTCVRPGGWLMFTTLAAGTFAGVNRKFGIPEPARGFQTYLEEQEFARWLATRSPWQGRVRVEEITEVHTGLADFLHTLKSIGACTTMDPVPAKTSVMRSALLGGKDDQPVEADYRVLFITLQNGAAT